MRYIAVLTSILLHTSFVVAGFQASLQKSAVAVATATEKFNQAEGLLQLAILNAELKGGVVVKPHTAWDDYKTSKWY